METNLRQMLEEIRGLEKAVLEQLRKKESDLLFSVQNRKVTFTREVRQQHERLRRGAIRFLRESSWPSLLVAPMIYSMLIPALILDAFACLYQAICFPVYRIPKVRRRDYIAFDRHRLRYLNWIERMNCDYCAYFNGVIAFVRELAARTEQYFCPIRHAVAVKGVHPRHADFLPYGDADDYQARLAGLREQVRGIENPPGNPPPETTACGEPRK